MRGIVDEVLFLDDGTAAPLDFKYAEYKDWTFKNYRIGLQVVGFWANLLKFKDNTKHSAKSPI